MCTPSKNRCKYVIAKNIKRDVWQIQTFERHTYYF